MARPRVHEFKKGHVFGCWQLLEDRQKSSRFTKALCLTCNKTIKEVEYSVLHRGTSKHCGCKNETLPEIGLEHNGFKVVGHSKKPKITIECLSCKSQKSINFARFLRTNSSKCLDCLITKRDALKIGQKYGQLTIVEVPQKQKRGVVCRCDCGNITTVDYVAMLNGATQSCGCKKTELMNTTNIEKFGVPFYSQSTEFEDRKKEIWGKARQTKIENGNMIVLPDGRLLWDVCNEAKVPFPYVFRLYRTDGPSVALNYIKHYDGSTNHLENRIIELLKEEFPEIEHYNKYPLEARQIARRPDFRLEKNGKILYLNIDGLYWHCDAEKEKDYHLRLRESFMEHDLNIMQFREDELNEKATIIKSMILNYFQTSQNKYNARSCEIKQVKKSSEFFEKNHLMGSCRADVSYGLYSEDKLVACMSIRHRNGVVEIARFATETFSTVRGGFSKLLSFIEKTYNPSRIVSFCDLRYATGASYRKSGFDLTGVTLGWKWTDYKETHNRLRCRANMDERKFSQAEHAKELGLHKIYDAGQAKYVKEVR